MKWQYHSVQFNVQQRPAITNTLVQLGQQNWELVSVITEQLDVAGQVLTMFFKRPG